MKKFCAIIFLLVAPIMVYSAQGSFEKANDYYRKGNFEQALKIYEEYLKGGQESAVIRYNMGNCYFRTGKIGKAVLNYEKARMLNPNDEDINHNLQIAKLHTVDKIDAVPKLFIFRWYEAATDMFSSSGWMKWLIILSLLFAAAGIAFLFSMNLVLRRYLALGMVLIFILLIVNSFLLYSRYQSEHEKIYAVVIEYAAGAKHSPNSSSTDAFSVHEGLKVKIEDKVDEWYKIRLEDGKVGWLLKGYVEII